MCSNSKKGKWEGDISLYIHLATSEKAIFSKSKRLNTQEVLNTHMHSLLLIIHSGNPESRQSIRTLRSAPPTACTFSSLGIIVYHLFNVTYKESWINTVLMFVQVSLHNDMKNVWDILDRPIYCLFLLASSFLNVCLFLFDIWYLP